jgi:thiol:disulfide interchange protein DsbC
MKKVIEKRIDIAFYIKLFPLRFHKDAYWKSKSIVCNRSVRMLEDNFEKRPIPKTECNTKEIDENIRFAERHGISGTPTMILPDGSIYQGTIDSEKLIRLIDESSNTKKTR